MSLYDDDRTIINPIKRSGIDEDPILNPIIKQNKRTGDEGSTIINPGKRTRDIHKNNIPIYGIEDEFPKFHEKSKKNDIASALVNSLEVLWISCLVLALLYFLPDIYQTAKKKWLNLEYSQIEKTIHPPYNSEKKVSSFEMDSKSPFIVDNFIDEDLTKTDDETSPTLVLYKKNDNNHFLDAYYNAIIDETTQLTKQNKWKISSEKINDLKSIPKNSVHYLEARKLINKIQAMMGV